MESLERNRPLELALSGGGTRAMAYHAGVIRFLAEENSIERIRHVSTVSGGSLLIGLLLHRSGMQWPSSARYLKEVLPAIRQTMTTCNLTARALARLLLPWNWRYALSRANLVAKTLEGAWGLSATLKQVPSFPEWSINGTTAETGRRFRFKSTKFGDYELGYAEASNFPLAQAIAVSAAFPGGIGPLAIESADYTWQKLPSWGAPEELKEEVTLPFERLHLYDGGVYDNLGTEPLFDIGKRMAKQSGATLIVSDAGAPLEKGFSLRALNPWRMKRLMDISMEQQRALRVRVVVNALQSGLPGAYLQIGSAAIASMERAGVSGQESSEWLSKEDARSVASVPTALGRMSELQFSQIERHGYETAKWNAVAHRYL